MKRKILIAVATYLLIAAGWWWTHPHHHYSLESSLADLGGREIEAITWPAAAVRDLAQWWAWSHWRTPK